MQATNFDALAQLASDSPTLQPVEASAVLVNLGRELARCTEAQRIDRALSAGRRLATNEVVEILLTAAEQPKADLPLLAGALRFRGATVVGVVLGSLHAATDRAVRRVYFQLATGLAAFPELHDTLVGSLEAALGDHRPEIVRNAIALLAAVGVPLPPESWEDLATSPHVQLRLAFAQVLPRQAPVRELLALLCGLIADEHPGVRLASAVALRAYPDPRARAALQRCLATETDAETKAICEGSLRAA
jgi:HEAT repeat protein